MSQLQFLELPKGVYLPLTIINPGLWYWKEDTRTLEFSCAQLKEEPKDTKEKNKKGKTIQFQELGAKPLERSGPHYFRNLFTLSVSSGEDKSPRPTKRALSELITLEDVKYAALFLAHEDDSIHVSSFSLVMRCKQLDGFLMALLYYISFYLEKITLEMKPKSFMGKPSILEKKEMKENQIKLAVTKKHLAEMYCILILGLGMSDQHHMACGKKKISSSRKDREFFECLYNFASYVAFVTFRQKNLKEIQQEVGRLLRSNIFNSALRERTKSSKEMKTDITKQLMKATFAFRKRTDVKQPAIRSVMDQRSPVLSTLLPLAKDSAQYLFQDHYLRPSKIAPRYIPEDLPELFSIVSRTKIGIIGSQRTKFVPHTLLPIGSTEDEKENGENPDRSVSSVLSQEITTGSSRAVQSSGSHQSVAVSRATTEGDYIENPQ
ncbi:protein phosphatase 1 regulatory subunit 36 isoform X1 [Ahaetulla prasina]|uniref:protein phosphatase 1 regulatory subunit 36 isoform X1 n=1 Tax=Ahaetulla prasina TaxID=499056 RepID=UPI002649E8FC|nr:protein phosphatase 1 regulatory subunit 36 isoform X1 [Ahaetulla prasina]XP_058018877.1 protein phosphatase 1 regulatory subunit 36 isoform X1 [Ahaetulla prasina]